MLSTKTKGKNYYGRIDRHCWLRCLNHWARAFLRALVHLEPVQSNPRGSETREQEGRRATRKNHEAPNFHRQRINPALILIYPCRECDKGLKTKLQQTHIFKVMSASLLSSCPRQSTQGATSHNMTTYRKRLTWKRSVVRIHYSPPFKMCANHEISSNLVGLGFRPGGVEKGVLKQFKTLYNTLRVLGTKGVHIE